MKLFDEQIKQTLESRLEKLENHFKSDVIFFYGPIYPTVEKVFRDFIEKLRKEKPEQQRLIVFLTTPGGEVETVEKLVEIIRFHYSEVYFVVPDYAMSAGTVFCMSGNEIYMDYSSSLGPIDPQVLSGKELVPAMGYLDQYQRMIEKSAEGTLTDAEFLMLQSQDLAMLTAYEQARDLTITLLKEWLVQYKFHSWTKHQTNPKKKGRRVTQKEKEKRAEEIAKLLADNKLWHSHGRKIGIRTLTTSLRLKIHDYSQDAELRALIRSYNDFLVEYMEREDYSFFLHSRNYFGGYYESNNNS
jgi:hypothetical protein